MRAALADLLIQDHRKIQTLCAELMDECGKAAVNESVCLNMFRTLKALTVAHLKAEEYTLYATFEDNPLPGCQGLRQLAFEGYEEHDLMDFLMKEMGMAEEVTPQWCAQVRVLANLLNRHMESEERDFLNRIGGLIDVQDQLDLGEVYMRERDMIFAKKSGMRPTMRQPQVTNTVPSTL